MQTSPLLAPLLGHTDIYLLDQIMKGRYAPGERLLDAGAGGGRNLHWFARAGFEVYGTDRDPDAVAQLKASYPELAAERFQLAPVEALPFADAFFDHVISSAVLHFAEDHAHFERMFAEMIRVLKPGGSFFARTATDVGMGTAPIPLGNGRFHLPDGSGRYLLARPLLDALMQQHGLYWLEPYKSVVVDGVRSMGVVVVGKVG